MPEQGMRYIAKTALKKVIFTLECTHSLSSHFSFTVETATLGFRDIKGRLIMPLKPQE